MKSLQQHAAIYARYKCQLDTIPEALIEKLMQENDRAFERIASVIDIQFVSGQPYETVEDLIRDAKEFRRIQISTDFNDSKLFGPQRNLEFRAIHDFFHVVTGGGFDYEGELRAYEAQKLMYSSDVRPIIFSEVVLQAAYAVHFGEFGKQKVIVRF